MANMNQHTVTLVSWDTDNLIAVIKIDSVPIDYTINVPRYDPSFSANPPNVADAIAWIKARASDIIDQETGLPDLTTYVGGTI